MSACLNHGFVRSAPSPAGALCTPGGPGRQALGLDRSHRPPPHALALAFARRLAAETLLEGHRVAPRPSDHTWAAPDYRHPHSASRLYLDPATGGMTRLLAGAPNPKPATVSRLIEDPARDAPILLVARDAGPHRQFLGPEVRLARWADVLPQLPPRLRPPLIRLLKDPR